MVANTRVELSIEGGPPRLACKSFEHERRFEMGSTMTVRYARSSCNLTFDVGMCLPACLSLSVIVFRGYDTPQDPTLTLCSRFSQTVDLPFISKSNCPGRAATSSVASVVTRSSSSNLHLLVNLCSTFVLQRHRLFVRLAERDAGFD